MTLGLLLAYDTPGSLVLNRNHLSFLPTFFKWLLLLVCDSLVCHKLAPLSSIIDKTGAQEVHPLVAVLKSHFELLRSKFTWLSFKLYRRSAVVHRPLTFKYMMQPKTVYSF